jgi:hypothetical protein
MQNDASLLVDTMETNICWQTLSIAANLLVDTASIKKLFPNWGGEREDGKAPFCPSLDWTH